MRKWWLLWVMALACLPAAYGQSADQLLPADQAFQFSAKAAGPDSVHVQWKIANQYHLYRKRIHISTDTPGVKLGKIDLPAGILEHDPVLGDSRVYRHQVAFNVPIKRSASAPDTVHLIAKSQGCSDAVGVCYPPQTQTADVKLPPPAPAASSGSSGAAGGSGSASSSQALSKLSQLGNSLGLNDQGGNEFLPPDQAFQFSAQAAGPDTLEAHWKIADGYYLYRGKFHFKLEDANGATLKKVELPPGKAKHDEFAGGTVHVFHHEVTARLPLARTGTGATTVKLLATYQGCAEAGICYPPVHKTVALKLPAGGAGAGAGGSGGGAAATAGGGTGSTAAAGTAATTAPTTAPPVSEQDRIAHSLAEGHLAVTIASFFGFGLLLAFTPCIFPMIPILSSIIVGQGETITTGRAFGLSAAYVLAMAVTYTAAGIIAALFGQNLQAAFQDPWILGTFAAVFVLLSLSMFGFYDLQMPAFIQSRLTNVSNRQRSGTLVGSAVMGFLSALIVGPCVAAPLAGALIYIGQTGNAVLGGAALFALSMGMGAPLMVIGTGAGKVLPRAGDWMNTVKGVFGVLLLAVAIWMLERILPGAITMALWAALLMVSSIYMGALDSLSPDATGWRRFWKGSGLVMLLYGAVLLVGAATGGSDPLQPLARVSASGGGVASAAEHQGLQFKRVKNLQQFRQQLQAAAKQGRPVMLDFYADWCVSCKEMEKYTFSKPKVQKALAGTTLLQADVTADNAADKNLLHHFGLIGPPSILFFGPDGKERRAYRVVGYMNASDFRKHVMDALQTEG